MYTVNQTNSLYFYPHRLRFAPIVPAEIGAQRDRIFAASSPAIASPSASPQHPRRLPLRTAASVKAEKNRQDFAEDRMEDDGGKHFRTESPDHDH